MSRKYILIIEALIAGLFLSACKNTVMDNKAGVGNTPTVKPIEIPSDAPVITIVPDIEFRAEAEKTTENYKAVAEKSADDYKYEAEESTDDYKYETDKPAKDYRNKTEKVAEDYRYEAGNSTEDYRYEAEKAADDYIYETDKSTKDYKYETLNSTEDYKYEAMKSYDDFIYKEEKSEEVLLSTVNINGDPAVKAMEVLQMFTADYISQDIKNRINGKSYAKDCTVPYEDLRYVKILYWGFDEETHSGELIVNKAIAEDIIEIFKELYEHKYQIEKMILIDEYEADDNASMAANNTSAFNYRTVDDGSGRLSNHSYGLAIDINPLYNPYVRKINGETVVSPEKGEEYVDRTQTCPYYVKKDDICYKAFTSRGFTWGGDWVNSKDYQHFQKKMD